MEGTFYCSFICYLRTLSHHLCHSRRLTPYNLWVVNGYTMLGGMHGPTMASPFFWLWPMERLLVLGVGQALGIDGGV